MRRLLSLAMLMMGTLILIISAFLANAPRKEPINVGVVSIESLASGILVYTILPENHRIYPITPGLVFYPEVLGVSPDGLWVYVNSSGPYQSGDIDFSTQAVYRVRLDGRVVERITSDQASRNVWSVDPHWIVYIAYGTEPHQRVLVERSLEGEKRQIIMAWTTPYEPTKLLMSPDDSQIAYTLQSQDGTETDVFVVPVAGGYPRNLTENIEGHIHLRLWTIGDEWLLATTPDYRLLGLRADGSEVQTIVTPAMSVERSFRIQWANKPQLLMFENYRSDVFMVRIGQSAPLWKQSGFPMITPDEQAVIFQGVADSYANTIWKQPILGGEGQKIVDVPYMSPEGVLSPDGKWLLMMTGSEKYYYSNLTRLNLQDGTLKVIYTDQEYFLYRWTVDGNWISASKNTGMESAVIIMRSDGRERHTIRFSEGTLYDHPLWYAGKSAAWSSRDVTLIAIGLMVVAVVAGRIKKTILSANPRRPMK